MTDSTPTGAEREAADIDQLLRDFQVACEDAAESSDDSMRASARHRAYLRNQIRALLMQRLEFLAQLTTLRAEQARDREGRIVGLPRGESAARNEICDALAEAIAWLGELGDAADEPTTLDIRREWHLGEDDGSLTVRGLLRLLTTNTADEAWRTDLDELVERTWRRVGKALVAARSVSLSTEATDGE